MLKSNFEYRESNNKLCLIFACIEKGSETVFSAGSVFESSHKFISFIQIMYFALAYVYSKRQKNLVVLFSFIFFLVKVHLRFSTTWITEMKTIHKAHSSNYFDAYTHKMSSHVDNFLCIRWTYIHSTNIYKYILNTQFALVKLNWNWLEWKTVWKNQRKKIQKTLLRLTKCCKEFRHNILPTNRFSILCLLKYSP